MSVALSRALPRNGSSPDRDQRFTVGFRPADVTVEHRYGDEATTTGASGKVYSFEPLGTKCVVTMTAPDGARVRALVPGRKQFRPDEQIRFNVRPQDLIFFDARTGEYITRVNPLQEDPIRG